MNVILNYKDNSSLKGSLRPVRIHHIILGLSWISTTTVLIILLINNVRNTGEHSILRYILQACYVMSLLWFLFREGKEFKSMPRINTQILSKSPAGKYLPVIVLSLALLFALVSDDGISIIMLLLVISCIWILISWRKQIVLNMIVTGLTITIIAFFCGITFRSNEFMGSVTFYGLLLFTTPMYIAGSLLIQNTGLSNSMLLSKKYGKALNSFLWGCIAFVPLGLLNTAEGSPGLDITWVTNWSMPLYLPFFSGIVEETWFRILLVTLGYFLLRPAFRKYPAIAVIAAMFFSAIIFGLGHGRTLNKLLTTGLLYGLPLAALFARRDFEHAIGAHYMVNMIPLLMVFMES